MRTPPLSVAPMMDRTDRHFRYLVRRISTQTLLYTEMVTAQAILRAHNVTQLLGYHPCEHPLALQMGGDDPKDLAICARWAEELGYDEINLNCGCPSDRVQKGRFGAALMAVPDRVAECVAAIKAVVRVPVTVKHRIGIDDQDAYEDMLRFVDVVSAAGTERFTVHARKAWLQGLSPKENRTIPPLRYEDVYRLKRERPGLAIEVNGGILNIESAQTHLKKVDAVMIGRAAYNDPLILQNADAQIFGTQPQLASMTGPEEVAEAMIPYLHDLSRSGQNRPFSVLRHMLGLFGGQPGARAYRRILSAEGPRTYDGVGVLKKALAAQREAKSAYTKAS